MKVFFDKLYFRYYKSQEGIGNGDIAPFSAMLIIVFTLFLYYFSLFFLLIILFQKEKLEINTYSFKVFSFCLMFGLIAVFSYFYLYKKRYKKIVEKYNNDKTGKMAAALFPLIAFILFNIGWVLKMLQNQGRF